MFFRTQNIDLVICLFYVILFEKNILNQKFTRLVSIMLVISIIFDLPWMIEYSTHWWNGSTNIYTDYEIELGIKRFVVILTYFAFFIKVGLVGVFWILSN